jgi:serine/threonine-protein phosphatase PGAM5
MHEGRQLLFEQVLMGKKLLDFKCTYDIFVFGFSRAMQFPPEAWLRISLNHTSLTMLSILPSGRVVLRSLGDSGHLPVDKMTTS